MENFCKRLVSSLFLLTAVSLFGGCDDNEITTGPSMPGITVTENEFSEFYEVTAPKEAQPGETVSVGVVVTDEKHYVEFVTANNVACTRVEGDFRNGTYEFKMPDSPVKIGVLIREFKAEEYPIKAEDTKEYTIKAPKTAEAGKTVDVEIVVSDGLFTVSACLFNGKPCDLVSAKEITWHYSFVMPAEAVELTVETDLDKHIISLKKGDNTYLRMLNCCDDWEAVPPVFDESKYGIVKFLWGAELGFDATLTITGQTTGTELPYEWTDKDYSFGKCWQCVMPDEPILLETKGVEKTDYLGKPFVGEYRGVALIAGKTSPVKGSSSDFTLSLKSNTSFVAKSTDANKFDFDGCYSFNDSDNTFDYIAEFSDDGYGEPDFGVSGTWLTDGVMYVHVNNLQNDKPENKRFYLMHTSEFTSVSVADNTYGSHYLVEMKRQDKTVWFYLEPQTHSITPVELTFTKGSSIGEACEALVATDGKILFKYSLTSANDNAVFTTSGKEAGTYTGASGEPELTLDGFGNATLGAAKGTYTIQGSIVSVTINGAKTDYQIDINKMTYVKVVAGEWDGPKTFNAEFTKESGIAVIYGKPTNGSLSIRLDTNFSGKEQKGAVKVIASVYDTDSSHNTEIANSAKAWSYDVSTQTLIVSRLLVGTEDGRSTERIDLRFKVSADKKTLTFEEDKLLRATSGGNNTYLKLKGVELKAQ